MFPSYTVTHFCCSSKFFVYLLDGVLLRKFRSLAAQPDKETVVASIGTYFKIFAAIMLSSSLSTKHIYSTICSTECVTKIASNIRPLLA